MTKTKSNLAPLLSSVTGVNNLLAELWTVIGWIIKVLVWNVTRLFHPPSTGGKDGWRFILSRSTQVLLAEAYSYWVTETLILPDITKTECNSCFNAGDKRSPQTILGRQYFIHCITLNILVIGIPVLYQPCVAGGRQLPARALVLSARSVLTCIAHECMIAPPAFSKVLMLHFSMNAETLEVEKERWSFEGHATMFVCFENT